MNKTNTDNSNITVYLDKNNRLILPDFVFSIHSNFDLTGNNNAQDFGYYVLTNIVGKTNLLYDNDKLDSEALSYYSNLYLVIKNEGGIDNCIMLSDFNVTGKNSLNELLANGILKKKDVTIDKEGNLSVFEKKQHILKQYIIRNVNSFIILPDDLYDLYRSYINNDPIEFAKLAEAKIYSNETLHDDSINFIAGIYSLIEKDGNCINLSSYFNNKYYKNYQELISAMLKFDKFKMYRVDIGEDGNIKETRVNIFDLINTIYDKKVIQQEETVIIDVEPDFNKIEEALNNIIQDMKISCDDDYIRYKDELHSLETNIYTLVNETQTSLINKNIPNKKAILNKLEKLSGDLLNKIDKARIKLRNTHNSYLTKEKDTNNIDYYEHIKVSIDEVMKELNTISQNMDINSNSDYMSINSKLSYLKEKLYDIFDSSMESALADGSITGTIIKEAATKHNNAINLLKELEELLESKHAQLISKHLFST